MAFYPSNSSLIKSNLLFRLSIHNIHVYFLLAVIAVSFGVQNVVSATGGDPSEGEYSVELMTWGKDTIIHRGRKDIHLAHYSPQNAVAVLIVNDVPWTQPTLRNLSGGFTIHAPPGMGVMAVVQVLNLRSDSVDSTCVDFLRFYDPKGSLGSPNICGKLSKEDKHFSPNGVIGPRMFHSPGGMIQIQYKSDKGESDPDRSSTTTSDDMALHVVEIVFTAYQECGVDDAVTSVCGDKCISPLVLCDERINCGFEDDFAKDEISCEGLKDEDQGASPYLVNLYLGAGLFLLILALVAIYHHQRAYTRIRNIPHK